MSKWMLVLLAMAAASVCAPAQAEPSIPPPERSPLSPLLRQRAEEVVTLLQGGGSPAELFTPEFLAQVPEPQLRAISSQLVAAHGAARAVETIEATGELSARIAIRSERALIRMTMGLEASPPHRIANLLVTGVEPRRSDTPEALIEEFKALPGQAGFEIARVDGERPAGFAAYFPDRVLAIGSTFKLIILAELSRQIQAGQRRWSDVVPLAHRSLPSGLLQDWPAGSPITIHSLAALMISRSDNTATDSLLHLVGRENVEAMMGRIGMKAASRNRPFLSTLELFQLKAAPEAARREWLALDEGGKRRLLSERYGSAGPEVPATSLFSGGPVAVDTIEWFASAGDLVRVMTWFRRNEDDAARAILAINPGLGADMAKRFDYLGFKGGSEPGVINLTFLVRNAKGEWHVVTGSWNNPAAPVDEGKFVGLMTRALQLVR